MFEILSKQLKSTLWSLIGVTGLFVSAGVSSCEGSWHDPSGWSPSYNVVVSQWLPAEIKIKMGRSGQAELSSVSATHRSYNSHKLQLNGGWDGSQESEMTWCIFGYKLYLPSLFIQSQHPLMTVFVTITGDGALWQILIAFYYWSLDRRETWQNIMTVT